MRVYIEIIVILLFVSCSTDKSNQCSVHHSNVDVTHELFTHLVSDKHHHYLFGVVRGNQLDYRTSEITIDRSIVGDEKNWISFSEKIPGKCWAVCQTVQNIFLISEQYELKDDNSKHTNHRLYKISKKTGIVNELSIWAEGNLTFGNLYFESDEIGYVSFVSYDNTIRQLLKTTDGGKNWEHIDLRNFSGNFLYSENNIYSLVSKRNVSNWIYKTNKQYTEIDSLQFDLNITDFSVGEKGDYWLLGKEKDKTVLQRYENGQTTDVHTFSDDTEISPDQLYKYNELIVVIASQVDKNMLGGFGGTKPLMFVSKDNGLTWDNHRLDEALYLKPISFYKDERMTAYLGDGKILTCEF